MTSTNGHRSRVCELNGNGRDTEALCRHLFSLAKAALKSVACFVVVYIYLVRRYGWGGGRRLTSTKKPTEGKIATSSFVFVQLRLSFRAKNKLCLECRRKWNLPGRNSTGPTHSLYVTRERVPSVKQGGQAKSTELRSIEVSGILG